MLTQHQRHREIDFEKLLSWFGSTQLQPTPRGAAGLQRLRLLLLLVSGSTNEPANPCARVAQGYLSQRKDILGRAQGYLSQRYLSQRKDSPGGLPRDIFPREKISLGGLPKGFEQGFSDTAFGLLGPKV